MKQKNLNREIIKFLKFHFLFQKMIIYNKSNNKKKNDCNEENDI